MGAWGYMDRKARIEAVRAGYGAGINPDEIAATYGTTAEIVTGIAAGAGISPDRLTIDLDPIDRARLDAIAAESGRPACDVARGVLVDVLRDDARAHGAGP